jgi:hypothetical protein
MQKVNLAIVSQCDIFKTGQTELLKSYLVDVAISSHPTITAFLEDKKSQVPDLLIFKPEFKADKNAKDLQLVKKMYPDLKLVGIFFNKEHKRNFKYLKHLDASIDGNQSSNALISYIKETLYAKYAENFRFPIPLNGIAINPDSAYYYLYCQLTPLKRKFLLHFSEGKSIEAISNEEGRTPRRVNQIGKEIRKIFGLNADESLNGIMDKIRAAALSLNLDLNDVA